MTDTNQASEVLQGDCLELMKDIPDNSVDSIVTDPPYELGFMGKKWDNTGIAYNKGMWSECLRVLKPGGHLLAFSGTRTYHRMASAIEDAGFEVRDMIEWVYGSGFPKSLNIGKAVDKFGGNNLLVGEIARQLKQARESRNVSITEADKLFCGGSTNYSWFEGRPAGQRIPNEEMFEKIANEWNELNDIKNKVKANERELLGTTITNKTVYQNIGGENKSGEIKITKGNSPYEGWGTALKPAHEPICMARKPLTEKTVAENVLKYGTGGINIDESRISLEGEIPPKGSGKRVYKSNQFTEEKIYGENKETSALGRFPANLIHDNSEEVRECFPDTGKGNGKGAYNYAGREYNNKETSMFNGDKPQAPSNFNDSVNASRFFKSIIYQAKASKSERNKGCEGLEEKRQNSDTQIRTYNDRCLTCGKKFVGPPEKICHCPKGLKITDKSVYTNKNNHPTVKPIALMEYLIKMVTPKGGVVLDQFAGSGSTLVAAKQNGFNYIGIEMTKEYIPIIEARLNVVDTKEN